MLRSGEVSRDPAAAMPVGVLDSPPGALHPEVRAATVFDVRGPVFRGRGSANGIRIVLALLYFSAVLGSVAQLGLRRLQCRASTSIIRGPPADETESWPGEAGRAGMGRSRAGRVAEHRCRSRRSARRPRATTPVIVRPGVSLYPRPSDCSPVPGVRQPYDRNTDPASRPPVVLGVWASLPADCECPSRS